MASTNPIKTSDCAVLVCTARRQFVLLHWTYATALSRALPPDEGKRVIDSVIDQYLGLRDRWLRPGSVAAQFMPDRPTMHASVADLTRAAMPAAAVPGAQPEHQVHQGSMSEVACAEEIGQVVAQVGLLHLLYARAAVACLGETKGRELVIAVITSYAEQRARWADAAEDHPPTLQEVYDWMNQTEADIPSPDTLPTIYCRHYWRAKWAFNSVPCLAFTARNCPAAAVWRDLGDTDGPRLGVLYCHGDKHRLEGFLPHEVVLLQAESQGYDHCDLVLLERRSKDSE